MQDDDNGESKVDKTTLEEIIPDGDLDTIWGDSETQTPTPRQTITIEEAQEAAKKIAESDD